MKKKLFLFAACVSTLALNAMEWQSVFKEDFGGNSLDAPAYGQTVPDGLQTNNYRLYNLDKRFGSLIKGRNADVVVVNDDLDIEFSYINSYEDVMDLEEDLLIRLIFKNFSNSNSLSFISHRKSS